MDAALQNQGATCRGAQDQLATVVTVIFVVLLAEIQPTWEKCADQRLLVICPAGEAVNPKVPTWMLSAPLW
jgi:hypothetical protein